MISSKLPVVGSSIILYVYDIYEGSLINCLKVIPKCIE
jgi:hypothetical protein